MRRIAFAMCCVVALTAVATANPTSVEKSSDSKLLDILKERNIITEQEHRELSALTIDETAQALGVSPRLVNKDWCFARAWLNRELGGTDDE